MNYPRGYSEEEMRIVNIGSINVDHVYEVDHFVRPGETLNSKGYQTFAGGKGFNQSIALSRAGAAPHHAGRVGKDAGWLLKRLQQEGVDTTHVAMCEATTGHAWRLRDLGGDPRSFDWLFQGLSGRCLTANSGGYRPTDSVGWPAITGNDND